MGGPILRRQPAAMNSPAFAASPRSSLPPRQIPPWSFERTKERSYPSGIFRPSCSSGTLQMRALSRGGVVGEIEEGGGLAVALFIIRESVASWEVDPLKW